MVLKVERESVYKNAKVTEPNGSVRIIPPLYFGQMIIKGSDGKFRYNNNMPKDYWDKRNFLISKGWESHYHFDIDWQKGEYNDRLGTTTENALKIEGYY